MSQASISIITVTYNSGPLLAKTIRNIAQQSARGQIEYIVVDGKSSDLEIIKANEEFIDKWISEPDKGIYDAMNKGLELATGHFVWFINAGDELYSKSSAEEVLALIDSETDVVYGETLDVTEQGEEIGPRRLKAPTLLTWRSFQKGMLVCHQSIVVRKSITKPYDTQYRISADQDWVISALKKARKIVNANQVLSKFAKGGTSGKNIVKSLKERFKIMTKHYGLVPTVLRHIPIAFRFVVYYLKNKRY